VQGRPEEFTLVHNLTLSEADPLRVGHITQKRGDHRAKKRTDSTLKPLNRYLGLSKS